MLRRSVHGQAQRFSANMGSGERPQPFGIRGKAKDLAPLGFGEDQLKVMHEAVRSRQSLALRTKAFSSTDSLLPAELQQSVVGPQ